MKHIEWGYLIVSYLFLGGLSAGLYFASAIGTLMRKESDDQGFSRIGSFGALLAPWPVMIGSFLLIFDLGRWYRFWKLFLHARWTSPMSLGSWLLIAFTVVSVVYCYSWLSINQRTWIVSRLPRWLRAIEFLNRDFSQKQRILALLGLPHQGGRYLL